MHLAEGTLNHLSFRFIRPAICVALMTMLMVVFSVPASAQMNPTSCGHFESQQAAQEHFDSYDLEFPGVLDPDEDGIACEFAFGGVVTQPAYVASQVTGLPSTGAGQGSSPESDGGFAPIVAVMLMLITWAAALTRHRSSR